MSDSHEEMPAARQRVDDVAATARRSRRRRARSTGWRNADVLRTVALVMATYLVLRLAWFARPLFLTAFLGILFGLAVASGVDYLVRFRMPRGLSAALIVLAFLGLLAGFGAALAPTIHAQGIELRQRLPDAIDRLDAWVNRRRDGILGMAFNGLSTEARADSAATTRTGSAIAPTASAQTPAPPTPGQTPDTAAADSTQGAVPLRTRIGKSFSGVSKYLFPFLSSTLEVVTGIVIIIFLSIYIAVDPGMYRRGILLLIPPRRRAKGGDVLSGMAVALRRWLVTQLIAMVTIGVVTTIALLVLRVKAAVALGLLCGLFEFIPTVGPIISSLPALAMGFLDSPEKALWVGLVYLGLHLLESHVLIPLLMKGGVDLPPALTILTQALMAVLFGLLGLMCAVPLLAAAVVAVKMLYVKGDVPDTSARPGGVQQAGAST